MYDRKFIFGVFSSSEQYFLCLIKYVFWLAPTGFVVLILTDTVSEEDESRFVKLQPFEKKKKKKISDLCLSEYRESPDWLWEGFTRRRPEQPVSSFAGTLTDSHGLYRQKMCHSWWILLYKEPYRDRREEADVPTAPVGFGC